MNHILFMNDAPIAVVIGDEAYRENVLKLRRAEHYFNCGRLGGWRDETDYQDCVHWHYCEIPTIEDRKEKNNEKTDKNMDNKDR